MNVTKQGKRPAGLTPGAYYRQVSQCRDKTIAVVYSILLLELIGAIEAGGPEGLAKVGGQLRVIFDPENRDVTSRVRAEDVTSVMRDVIKKMCKL